MQDNLLKYSYSALLSYHDDILEFKFDFEADNIKLHPHRFINKPHAQCWIFNDTEMIVCFRGTDSWTDVLINLKCLPHAFHVGDEYCGIVHRGFWEYYMSLRQDVVEEIATMKPKKVVFVGHSLGGCVMLLALECALNYKSIKTECYTFGSPGIGDEYFEKKLVKNTRVLKVRYESDLVPNICISKHVTRELVLRDKSNTRIHMRWLHHHNMKQYVQGIRDVQLNRKIW